MNRVEGLRKARGWSQAELARRAGMHPSTVSLIERGYQRAYPSQIEKLSTALGVSAAEIEADVTGHACG